MSISRFKIYYISDNLSRWNLGLAKVTDDRLYIESIEDKHYLVIDLDRLKDVRLVNENDDYSMLIIEYNDYMDDEIIIKLPNKSLEKLLEIFMEKTTSTTDSSLI